MMYSKTLGICTKLPLSIATTATVIKLVTLSHDMITSTCAPRSSKSSTHLKTRMSTLFIIYVITGSLIHWCMYNIIIIETCRCSQSNF